MPSTSNDFAVHCCDLLSSIGACRARRMFSGWGLGIDGLTLAIVTDLGSGDKLWLKASDATRGRFEAAGCERFSYAMRRGDKKVERSMNYYSAPEAAMDSAQAMAPWARLALDNALQARATTVSKPVAKKKSPRAPRTRGGAAQG